MRSLHIHRYRLILFILMFVTLGHPTILRGDPARGPENKKQKTKRPYKPTSPWNLRIGPNPEYANISGTLIKKLKGHFGCDPNQYTYPVYDEIDEDTSLRKIRVTGVFSHVSDAGSTLDIRKDVTVKVPVPGSPEPSKGTDSQVIFVNPQTGDEWGFWRFRKKGDGSFVAQNGYHYNTNWSGVPPMGFVSRGAGMPYLAGLVRPEEIRRGKIEHALAFGAPDPSALFVYPATKSDGEVSFPALPEGTRLQLDPKLTDKDFEKWGLDRTGKIIARALQEYGMILVDGSGHPKIYVEDHHTAGWGKLLHPKTVSPIPYSAFRVLSLNTPQKPQKPRKFQAGIAKGKIMLRWEASEDATRYRIKRRKDQGQWEDLRSSITQTRFEDTEIQPGASYTYALIAVNHNGLSDPVRITVTLNQ